MKKMCGVMGVFLLGMAFTVAVVCGATLLIQNSGALIVRYGETLGLHSQEVKQFSDIFGQLRKAEFAAGWLPVGSVCCLLCFGCNFVFRKKSGRKKAVYSLLIMLLLFLPLVFFGVCMTEVNGILFGNALRVLIPPILSGGL